MTKSATREAADGELFKSTGIDDNATSTKVTVSNTGIAVTGRATTDGITSSGTIIFDNGNSSVGIHSDSSDGSYIAYGANEYLRFLYDAGGGETMRMHDSGYVTMPQGVTLGNGNTYAAANTLDDYEEGTWTPAILYGSLTITTIEAAHYTKIGNVVVLQAYLTLASDGNGTDMQITGLPFANGGTGVNANQYSMGGVAHGGGANMTEMKYCRTQSNASYITIYKKANANVTQTDVQGNYFLISVTYRTTA